MSDLGKLLVTGVVAIVVGALAGFGSATWLLKDQIGQVAADVAELTTRGETVWTPGATRANENTPELGQLKLLIHEIRRNGEANRLLRQQLVTMREEFRLELAREIREMRGPTGSGSGG